jgi:hypothetical protein
VQLLVDTSSGVLRPLVPVQYRWQIFECIHSLAHPGIRASRRPIGSRILWPNLAKDVAEWCRQCTHCQVAKVRRQAAAEVQPILTTIQCFSHVHVDLVGPLPVSAGGFPYLLTAIYRTTSWFDRCIQFLYALWAATMWKLGIKHLMTTTKGQVGRPRLAGAPAVCPVRLEIRPL